MSNIKLKIPKEIRKIEKSLLLYYFQQFLDVMTGETKNT